MRILLSCLICITFSGVLSAQSSVASIPDWKREDNNGQVRFTPAVLFNNIPLHYDVYPPLPGGKDDLPGWLQTVFAGQGGLSGPIAPPFTDWALPEARLKYRNQNLTDKPARYIEMRIFDKDKPASEAVTN